MSDVEAFVKDKSQHHQEDAVKPLPELIETAFTSNNYQHIAWIDENIPISDKINAVNVCLHFDNPEPPKIPSVLTLLKDTIKASRYDWLKWILRSLPYLNDREIDRVCITWLVTTKHRLVVSLPL